jgi:hypothetical protein
MILRNLPLPIYILVCICICVSLFYIAIRRKNIDRFALRLVYITIAIGAIFCIIGRIFYNTYSNYIDYLILGFLLTIIIEFIYLTITHKGSNESKKIIFLGWVVLLLPLIIVILLFCLL